MPLVCRLSKRMWLVFPADGPGRQYVFGVQSDEEALAVAQEAFVIITRHHESRRRAREPGNQKQGISL